MKQSEFRKPPVAKVEPKILEKFGVKRQDNYFWIKEKENEEVIDYIKAENDYTDNIMDSTKELQEKIFDEIKGRIKEDDESYPTFRNGYYYHSKNEKGKQYAVILRKESMESSEEQVVFDINKLAEGQPAYIFAGYTISPDNKLAAYLSNTTGSFAEYELKIRDIASGKDIDFSLTGVASMQWAKDNETLFYSVIDSSFRSSKVYKQSIVDKQPILVYEEKDVKFSTYVAGDKRNKLIYIANGSSTTSEEMFISADEPNAEFKVFLPRKFRTEYSVALHNDCFYVSYKDDDNLNGKIYQAPIATYSDMSTWTEIVKHDENVAIEGVSVFEDYLALTVREGGLIKINILDINNNYQSETIDFPEETYYVGLSGNAEFKADKIRYVYTSPKRPSTLFEYDIKSKQTKTLKVQEIPSGFNSDDYVVERKLVKAKDGKEVPMSILYKKDTKLDGTSPALLYSYGSYGYSTETSFTQSVYSLVDRGFVYAIAQIRGGSEMGEQWYEDGKMLNKKNTFTDYIACSEYLIDNNYVAKDKLSAMGGSAGGLLMGAVANMRPDLYQNVLLLVPFLDVVTTMLDETLPLTTGEYEEWGNPNDKEYFDYMLSYSPYDNLEAKDYPNMLVTGGINDSQVLYHEPTKYVAKLRTLKTDDNLLLLHMNMESGHHGATGRYDKFKDTAFNYAFILAMQE